MEAIQNFDYIILNAIQQSMRCDFFDLFTVILNYITTSGIIWILSGIIMLFFRKMRNAGIILLVSLTIAFMTSDMLIKPLVNRPRPFIVDTDAVLLIKKPSGASFPSTHSCLAAAATTVLIRKSKLLGFVAVILTTCIVFSRLYLCAHYPTDVFSGLILGVLCSSLILWLGKQIDLERKINHNKKNSR